jgi:hypothetical protein
MLLVAAGPAAPGAAAASIAATDFYARLEAGRDATEKEIQKALSLQADARYAYCCLDQPKFRYLEVKNHPPTPPPPPVLRHATDSVRQHPSTHPLWKSGE